MNVAVLAAARHHAPIRPPAGEAPATPVIAITTPFLSTLVVQGSTVTRTITLTRTAYTDPVSLAATSLPTGVTASFSPTTYTGGALTSVLTLTAAADAPLISGDPVLVTASGSGVPNATLTLSLTVTDLANFSGPAELPRSYAADEAMDVMPAASTVSMLRRFYVTGSGTSHDVVAKTQAAFAATGGTRLIIFPDNMQVNVTDTLPVNADPAYPVMFCNARWAAGTVTYTPGIRPERASYFSDSLEPPAWVPTVNTAPYGIYGVQDDTIWRAPNNATQNVWWVGLNVRTRPDTINAYTFWLWELGDTAGTGGNAFTVANLPDKLFISHCYFGGHKFNANGAWHPGLGATVQYNCKTFGMQDCYDIDHGAAGSGGSDRGIVTGYCALGPHAMRNVQTNYGGGITWMHGGGAQPVGWPQFADAHVHRNKFTRQFKFKPGHADALFDVNGIACNWTCKNQMETKQVKRGLFEYNLFDESWYDGQEFRFVFKQVHQDTNIAQLVESSDITLRYNVFINGNACFGISASEGGDNGALVGPLTRVHIHDNSFCSGGNGIGNRTMLWNRANQYGQTVSYQNGAGSYLFERNWFWNYTPVGSASSAEGFISGGWELPITMRNTVFGGAYRSQYPLKDQNDPLYDFNDVFSASKFPGGITLQKNVHIRDGTLPPPGDSIFGAGLLYLHGVNEIMATDLGDGIFALQPGSPLIGAATDGGNIEPNWTILADVVTRARTGNWVV